ncbi:tetratricopeptide repeat protein [Nocardia niigatensis]
MNSLGVLSQNRGDRDEAETWYRRAADEGNAHAMVNLGKLLKKRRR